MLQNRPLAPSVASIAASVLSSRASNRFRIKLTAACAMHIAMREPFDIPEDDQFMTISDYDDSNFRYGKTRFGIERSDDVLFMKVNAMNTRTPDQKKALYAQITYRLGQAARIRQEDVFVNLIGDAKDNFSLGCGLAQYA